jgi:hypothetical protein
MAHDSSNSNTLAVKQPLPVLARHLEQSSAFCNFQALSSEVNASTAPSVAGMTLVSKYQLKLVDIAHDRGPRAPLLNLLPLSFPLR